MRGFPEYLRDNGWEVHVVSAPGPLLDAMGSVEGVSAHSLPMAREPSPFGDLKSLVAWIRLLRTIRPTVSSIGTPKAGLVGGIAAWLVGVPHRVYVLRGLRLETTTGLSRHIFSLAERVAVASAHHVLSVSSSLRARAVELGLVPSRKIFVLGSGSSNGVDTVAYARATTDASTRSALRASLGIAEGVPVVGFVGRLTADKGLAVLAEARELLAESGTDYSLMIIGGIDDGQDASVVEQLAATGRPAIVTGHVSDPRPYYSIMDVLCLPTFREGFPNVVLEAASMGVPAVTTNATGAVDSVLNGKTGLVVDVRSGHALADGLRQLLDDAELRHKLGAAARDRVVSEFDRSTVWGNHDAFFNALIGSSGKSMPTTTTF
ncbi:glycosyltransferase family 4 protein [Rhodoglobus sp. NPDC076762]